jgi:putative intracellular protease/amidase
MPKDLLHKVLFVCTSSKGSWTQSSGVWLDELAIPYYTLLEAGFTAEICSVAGGQPPVDVASYNSENFSELNYRFQNDPQAQIIFRNAKSLRSYLTTGKLSDFGCIFLCGGHGCVDDFPNNTDITEAVEFVYNVNQGCVAAICHGPLGLLDSKIITPDDDNDDPATADTSLVHGELIIKGKFVAAFSNEEESILGLEERLRLLTETKMDECGAVCVPRAPWKPNAVVDGRLVTGQNPQSSLEVSSSSTPSSSYLLLRFHCRSPEECKT